MKKKLFVLLAVIMVLSLMSIPALAGPPDNSVEGVWRYLPTITNTRVANGNTFLTTSEEGEWSGTFDGISTEDGSVVIHSSGAWSFKGTVHFDGKVNTKEGKLEMRVSGSKDAGAEWVGKWVITGGTGALKDLRGQGTWWGPGWLGVPDVYGVISYSGNIHFEPD